MDINAKLRSILAPSTGPVNRAHPVSARPATSAGDQSFAQALRDASGLEDPSIGTFGVLERLPRPVAGQSEAPGSAGGPTISPEIPTDPILDDHPIDTLHIEMRDTLESMVILNRDVDPEVLQNPEPLQPPGGDDARPADIGGPTVTTTPALSLPPLGVEWASVAIRGTGGTGIGIAGSDQAALATLDVKHRLYNLPKEHGAVSTMEARLFHDAVDRGYVENSPAGLGTLLGYLSMGSVASGSDPVRPVQLTNYFNQFFAAERAASNG